MIRFVIAATLCVVASTAFGGPAPDPRLCQSIANDLHQRLDREIIVAVEASAELAVSRADAAEAQRKAAETAEYWRQYVAGLGKGAAAP